MQRITRARLVLSLALVGALALAGCGGDDAYSISAEDQARINTLTDDVAAANKKAADDLAAAKTQAEADLKTAQDEIDSLTAQIGMMPGDDGMGGSGLQGDLAMYKATAADLEIQIGMMDDPTTEADESSGLKGQLAMYQAKAVGLQATLGMMTDGDMAATGLYKELADAQFMVAQLQTQIGDMPGDDGMGGSGLEADLAKYKGMVDDLEMKIGMMADGDMAATGLYKELADAMAEAKMYKDMVGMEADGDNPATGLSKKVADAEAKAAMYKARLDVLQGTIDTGEMADASVMAKALYMKLADTTDDRVDLNETVTPAATDDSKKVDVDALTTDTDGNALPSQAIPELNVMTDIEDGMLTAKAKDYTMADAAPDMIEGWQGVMLTDTDKDGNTVVLYSDKGATDKRLFDEFDGDLGDDGVRTYTVDEDTDDAIKWNNVKRDAAAATGGAKPGSTEFMGSVMNIPGTFSCTTDVTADAACGVPDRHSDGTVDATPFENEDPPTTGWMFVPVDPLARIPGADANYLVFGWWLMKDAGGMPDSYGPIATAIGMVVVDESNNATGAALTGTATYEGGAAGKYALPSPTDDTYEGGHFTAMATITADFDADLSTGGTNDFSGIALSGMIDNFMTGDTPRPNWMVKLMADSQKDSPGLQPLANLFSAATSALRPADNHELATEWSMGTAVKIPGTWRPTFYYGAEPDGPDVPPMAVVGTFNAMGDAGKLEGAFGAMKGD